MTKEELKIEIKDLQALNKEKNASKKEFKKYERAFKDDGLITEQEQ